MTTHLDTLKEEMLNHQKQYEHELYRKELVQMVIDEYNKQGEEFYLKIKSIINNEHKACNTS